MGQDKYKEYTVGFVSMLRCLPLPSLGELQCVDNYSLCNCRSHHLFFLDQTQKFSQ